MEDSSKNTKTEKPIEGKNDSKKETIENPPKVPVKRIRVRAKAKPAASVLPKSAPVPVAEEVVSSPVAVAPKAAKQVHKKEIKAEEKIVIEKSKNKEKPEPKPMVQNVVLVVSKDEEEKPDQEKKDIKLTKKKAKKIGKKVVKLKKKVKQAKKKEVKKSKLKGLKEKLEKALEKFKTTVKKTSGK
jgi:hypothetical protein